MSGYQYCACRDCMETTISSGIGDTFEPTLCHDCESAGCDVDGESECSSEGAYGGDFEEPSEGDYILGPSGNLGSKTSVSIHEGKYVGEYDSDDEAHDAIRAHRHTHSPEFYPNVWFCSDHGNLSCYGEPGFGEGFKWEL